jgi:tRNA modification GTPase
LVLWVSDLSAASRAASEPDLKLSDAKIWGVENKIDRAPPKNESWSSKVFNQSFPISAIEGTGVDGLIAALTDYTKQYFAQTEATIVTRARHRQALEETVAALNRALGQTEGGREELIAEELRSAATTLGRLIGRVDVEDLLDVIFRDFCIGK